MNYLKQLNVMYYHYRKEADLVDSDKISFLAERIFSIKYVGDELEAIINGVVELADHINKGTTSEMYQNTELKYTLYVNLSFFDRCTHWEMGVDDMQWEQDVEMIQTELYYSQLSEIKFKTPEQWQQLMEAVVAFAKGNMAAKAFTGSAETESELYRFIGTANGVAGPVPRTTFTDDYMWKVMTEGRAGKGDRYEGSTASDDVGGFFEENEHGVWLTEKALENIRITISE